LASIDAGPLKDFNAYAKAAVIWTQEQLIPAHRAFLGDNPLRREEEGVTLLHGTPRDPVWEYFLPSIMSTLDVAENFQQFSTQCCLVGHSHIPFVCSEMGTGFTGLQSGQEMVLAEARRVVNPGSVGQPRDGDPRAAYALYDADADTLTHYRVEYDVAATQAKIAAAGLPDVLASRLALGR
jgi:diadenosine tetraphosphatase ApaH/serine/threonine PP2A family protein phosphatase